MSACVASLGESSGAFMSASSPTMNRRRGSGMRWRSDAVRPIFRPAT